MREAIHFGAATKSILVGEQESQRNFGEFRQRAGMKTVAQQELFTEPLSRVSNKGSECGLGESFLVDGKSIKRIVQTNSGVRRESRIEIPDGHLLSADLASEYDLAWLRSRSKPPLSVNRGTVRIVDLFCGAGGISIGIEEACRALGLEVEHILGADIVPQALETYRRNFSTEYLEERPIETWLDGGIGQALTQSERELRRRLKHIDLLVGGPPCQGHSDLNNHTRREDPKNELYERMARFAEVVEPNNLIIENVPGVRHDKSGVFQRTLNSLVKLGYKIDVAKLGVDMLGVPQLRHRAVVVASTQTKIWDGFLLNLMQRFQVESRSVGWAIGDLLDIEMSHPIDTVTKVSAVSQSRIDWLFDHNEYDLPDSLRPDCHRTKAHTYKSVYGRLYWDRPAWTITTGFQVMGQGRFLHPLRRRVMTSHEAARLQFFPDFFDFGITNRKGYSKMIGNAVPSKLAYVLALGLLGE